MVCAGGEIGARILRDALLRTGPQDKDQGSWGAAYLLILRSVAKRRVSKDVAGAARLSSNLRQRLAVDAGFVLQVVDRHVSVVPGEPRAGAEAFGEFGQLRVGEPGFCR